MHVKILGTRGEIEEKAPFHSKHTGILIDDELLIDVGEKSFLITDPKWILISHFHPDHAYFVRRKHEEIPDTKGAIFAPEKLKGHKNITVLNKKKKVGPYTVIPIPTHHSKQVASQAYVIKRGGKSLLFTSDLVWIDKEFHPLIGTVDLVITEASFIRKGGMIKRDSETGQIFGHNGVPNLISLLKKFSKNLLFIHFGAWFYKNIKESRRKLQQLGKDNGVNVIVGYDGQNLKIGEYQ